MARRRGGHAEESERGRPGVRVAVNQGVSCDSFAFGALAWTRFDARALGLLHKEGS